MRGFCLELESHCEPDFEPMSKTNTAIVAKKNSHAQATAKQAAELSEKAAGSADIVALEDRRHPMAMGLLWITMVTSYPTVLIGVEWYRNGFSLIQVLACTVFSAVIALVFCASSAQLGAITGRTYGHLNRSVFGRWGARMTTFNLIAIFLACYAFGALCMADAVSGLFSVPISIGVMAAAFSFLMCLNNLWGFSGVVNFAKYFAAPCLITWVAFTFMRAVIAYNTATTVLPVQHTSVSWTVALGAIASFVIGFSIWGNEADYWRHAKPGIKRTAIPLLVALCIGQIIFPITGWMVAQISQVTDTARATAFMNEFSFGGVALLALIVIGAQYFAAADSNLYAVVEAFDNLFKVKKKYIVFAYAFICALVAYWFSFSGVAKSIEVISTLNGILIPTGTTILLCEWSIAKLVSHRKCRIFDHLQEMHDLPALRIPAMLAFAIGCSVGVVTAGLIPALEHFHVGIGCINAWATAAVIYLPARLIEEGLAKRSA
ncbi:hypothetical protein BH11CYA1_BH11CYA1_11940 [soil metagenome]